MVTGRVRVMQETDPRKVFVQYEKPRWSEMWDYNPRIARPQDKGDFQILIARTNGLRPYCAAKSPVRWTWKNCPPPLGELYLSQQERNFGRSFADTVSGAIIVEPNKKNSASPNKDWGWHRWVELTRLMTLRGLRPVQIGAAHSERLPDVGFIKTDTFRQACAVMRLASAVVLPEGGLHHAAAALGKKSIVIFGGFISPRQTGYDSQVNLFTASEPCGWRTPCAHCAEAMAKITPDLVMTELEKLLA